MEILYFFLCTLPFNAWGNMTLHNFLTLFFSLNDVCPVINRVLLSIYTRSCCLSLLILRSIRPVSVRFSKPTILIIGSRILNCLFLILSVSFLFDSIFLKTCSSDPCSVHTFFFLSSFCSSTFLLPQVRKLSTIRCQYRRIDIKSHSRTIIFVSNEMSLKICSLLTFSAYVILSILL